ncbi:MAG: hypothetical protein KC438_10005 [Thermomicrobiales bacterium]|nr:hypothetical protein [Thermomicrobiales bacterium]MCO5221293.1 hypothetical protein [Thermomicrobiales bacterium]
MGQALQARRLGCQLSAKVPDPRPVALPLAGGEIVTGIEWKADDTALLFLHDPDDELALDSWGAWPDRFAQLGYSVLVVDLPADHAAAAVATALGYLRHSCERRLLVIAAGATVSMLGEQSADAFVLVAPRVAGIEPSVLGVTPKLIVAGTADPVSYAPVETFARGCRGWSLLSTFAAENSVEALMEGRHATQAGSQIASFLQEHRTATPAAASRSRRRIPR